MARKKGKRPKQRLIEVCQNDGGLGIPACADRLRDHAEEMGYEVDLD